MSEPRCCMCGEDERATTICAACRRKAHEIRGALRNLVDEVRAARGLRNQLGLRVNVALNVADRVLKTDADG